MACSLWKEPVFPVKPWQMTRVFLSTQTCALKLLMCVFGHRRRRPKIGLRRHRLRTLAVAESRRAARSDGVRSDSVPRSIFWGGFLCGGFAFLCRRAAILQRWGLFGNGTALAFQPLIAQSLREINGRAEGC